MDRLFHYWQLIAGFAVACIIVIFGRRGLRFIQLLRGNDPVVQQRDELQEECDNLKREKSEWVVNKEFLFDEAASARIVRDRNVERLEQCRLALHTANETIARMKAVIP